jgi:hypothetical protein
MIKNLSLLRNFNFIDFIPFRKQDFYAFDSSDEEMIQKISDEGIGGDEGVNMEENIEKVSRKVLRKALRRSLNRLLRRSLKKSIWRKILEILLSFDVVIEIGSRLGSL